MVLNYKSAVDDIFLCGDCHRFHHEKDGSAVSERYCFVCKRKVKQTYRMPVTNGGEHMKMLNVSGTMKITQVCEECMRNKYGLSDDDIKAAKVVSKDIDKALRERELEAEKEFGSYGGGGYGGEYSAEDIMRFFESHHEPGDTVVYRDFKMSGTFKDAFEEMKSGKNKPDRKG